MTPADFNLGYINTFFALHRVLGGDAKFLNKPTASFRYNIDVVRNALQ
jgi:hypothetical protein